MAKSKTAPRRTIKTPAGNYPSKMEQLKDADGKVSLDVADYTGYTEDEMRAFFSQLPYEIMGVFSPDGRLVHISSQFGAESVSSLSLRELDRVIRDDGGILASGEGYTEFHNHPLNFRHSTVAIPIFSPDDIGSYAFYAEYSYNGKKGGTFPMQLPMTYSVSSIDGKRFELKYVGRETKDIGRFQSNYGAALNKAFNVHNTYENYKQGGTQLIAELVTRDMDGYLRRNANKYGFEYSSEGIS